MQIKTLLHFLLFVVSLTHVTSAFSQIGLEWVKRNVRETNEPLDYPTMGGADYETGSGVASVGPFLESLIHNMFTRYQLFKIRQELHQLVFFVLIP